MRTLVLAALCLSSHLAAGATPSPKPDDRAFEMRTYYACPGKLDDLLARFRDHTLRLFRKHGITNLGYFVPADNVDNCLIYFLAFPSAAAREKAFAAFMADPAWRKAAADSEKNGPLVTRVESVLMRATDYSPRIRPSAARADRAFELRVYTANAGKLSDLHARFRDHTMKLFKKHGITNVAYWTPLEGTPNADTQLIYVIAHRDRDAAKRSWAAFASDPTWLKLREESEKAGPILATPPVSTFLTPTDFSPTR